MTMTIDQYNVCVALGIEPNDRANIGDNFAGACMNNSVQELICGLGAARADKTDCETWDISASEWRSSIRCALSYKMYQFNEAHGEP